MNMLHFLNNGPLVGFYVLSFVAIFASLRVVMLANPVHAILSMIVTLLAIAGIFFVLGSPFAGALQIIVYAGAILVLFVFVIMMLNLGITNDERESDWLSAKVWAVPTGLTIIMAVVLFALIGSGASVDDANNLASAHQNANDMVLTPIIGMQTISPQEVGFALFTEYLLLVEVAALLLLGALVAAYHLGKRALDDENVVYNSQSIPTDSSYKGEHADRDPLVSNSKKLDDTYEYQPVNATDFQPANLQGSNPQNSKFQSSKFKSKESL